MSVGVSIKPRFRDRHAAGLALVPLLRDTLGEARPRVDGCDEPIAATRHDVIVLGMARGGVAVAAPIARALAAPLHAFIGRKLGVPGIEEVAFGAIAEGRSAPVLDAVHDYIGLPRTVVRSVYMREREEMARRIMRYRDGASLPSLRSRTVVLVDDGLASGATLRAAGIAIQKQHPSRLIAAVPVSSVDGLANVKSIFGTIVTVETPTPFGTVSDWYHAYESIGDAEVRALLGLAPRSTPQHAPAEPRDTERLIEIPTGETGPTTTILADLGQALGARGPRGLVIFAHGGGSTRGSYRNRYLAARLRLAGWATLRVDLLSAHEHEADAAGDMRFDIVHITRRLRAATNWCIQSNTPGAERIVLVGASTGAAAAMGVASTQPARVMAVVARGGRIDLAHEALPRVRAPTLLVVGGADHDTMTRNRECAALLGGPVTLREVSNAGHTFEEPGALGRVGELVADFLGDTYRRDRMRRWWRSVSR